MSGTHSLLEKIYERDPANGNYIIEVSLDNYADIFNDWDHAPFRRRDLDPGLLNFLEDSIDDIPMKQNIDIRFFLSDQVRSAQREQQIIEWFRTFYKFNVELERKKIRTILKKSMIWFLVSALFLVSSYFGQHMTGNNLLVYLLSETMVVGGWVFLWETISLLTFERADIHRLIKNFNRFARADIAFRYKQQ